MKKNNQTEEIKENIEKVKKKEQKNKQTRRAWLLHALLSGTAGPVKLQSRV